MGVVGAALAGFFPKKHEKYSFVGGYFMMMTSVMLLSGVPAVTRFVMAVLVFKFALTFVLPWILSTIAYHDHSGKLISSINLVIDGGFAIGPWMDARLIESMPQNTFLMFVISSTLLVSYLLCCLPTACWHHSLKGIKMRKTAFYFDELCLWHSTGLHAGILEVGGWGQPPSAAGHAETPETKRRLKNLLDVSGLTKDLEVLSAKPVSQADALLVHTSTYLDNFKLVSDKGGGMLGDNAPIGPGSYEIAFLSVGLASQAVSSVFDGHYHNAYALSRPPGHHCLSDQSMGFCFFNNIAIAIEKVKRDKGLQRAAVLDWDVYHGNGTQAIFEQRDDVLTISIHQQGCFPPGFSGENERGKRQGAGH